MTMDDDEIGEWLERIGDIVRKLKRAGVPQKLIDDFQKATLGPINKQQSIAALSGLTDYLLARLVEIKKAEIEGSAPHRLQGMMPKSIIASTTMEILDFHTNDFEGSPNLRKLVTSLLDIHEYQVNKSRRPKARSAAILLLLLVPDIGVNEISRLTGVSSSTVSRWKKEDGFQEELEDFRETFKVPAWKKMARKALMYTLVCEIGVPEDEAEGLIP
jgi:hypothetical protein